MGRMRNGEGPPERAFSGGEPRCSSVACAGPRAEHSARAGPRRSRAGAERPGASSSVRMAAMTVVATTEPAASQIGNEGKIFAQSAGSGRWRRHWQGKILAQGRCGYRHRTFEPKPPVPRPAAGSHRQKNGFSRAGALRIHRRRFEPKRFLNLLLEVGGGRGLIVLRDHGWVQ